MDFSIDIYIGSTERIIKHLKDNKITTKSAIEEELRSSAKEAVRMGFFGGGQAGVQTALRKVEEEFNIKLYN